MFSRLRSFCGRLLCYLSWFQDQWVCGQGSIMPLLKVTWSQ